MARRKVIRVRIKGKLMTLREVSEKYTDEQVKAMSHKEVSNVIENYKTSMRDEELYDECMSFGLPNC